MKEMRQRLLYQLKVAYDLCCMMMKDLTPAWCAFAIITSLTGCVGIYPLVVDDFSTLGNHLIDKEVKRTYGVGVPSDQQGDVERALRIRYINSSPSELIAYFDQIGGNCNIEAGSNVCNYSNYWNVKKAKTLFSLFKSDEIAHRINFTVKAGYVVGNENITSISVGVIIKYSKASNF
jgi:hypothetical protein